MLTAGFDMVDLKGEGSEAYSEMNLESGHVCRMYKESGEIKCKAPGETEWKTRADGPLKTVVEGNKVKFKDGINR